MFVGKNTLGYRGLRDRLSADMGYPRGPLEDQAFGLRVPQAYLTPEMSILDSGTSRIPWSA